MSARNQEIIQRGQAGEGQAAIARAMGLTVGTVAGVLYRDRNPPTNYGLWTEAWAEGVWPYCRHPRTPENTQRVGVAGERCKACRREISRKSEARRAAAKSAVRSMLTASVAELARAE